MPLYIIAILLGLIVGSFLNVCIYRMPRGLSIIAPPSSCPSCNAAVRPYDNIPIISFFILRGRCRHCGSRISARYPLVESANAALYVLVLLRFGAGWQSLVLFAFCSAMLVITFIDLDFQIIPDSITLPGIVTGFVTASLLLSDPFERGSVIGIKNSLAGLFAGGGLFYLIAAISQIIFRQEAMGGGDIKMMAMIGAFLGWKAILLTTFCGSLFGSVSGIFLMAFKGKGRKAKIPFGPFLAAGALISLFFGQEILGFYLRA